jgi:hypothetical protein
MGEKDGPGVYGFEENNPAIHIDALGLQSESADGTQCCCCPEDIKVDWELGGLATYQYIGQGEAAGQPMDAYRIAHGFDSKATTYVGLGPNPTKCLWYWFEAVSPFPDSTIGTSLLTPGQSAVLHTEFIPAGHSHSKSDHPGLSAGIWAEGTAPPEPAFLGWTRQRRLTIVINVSKGLDCACDYSDITVTIVQWLKIKQGLIDAPSWWTLDKEFTPDS